MKTPADIDANVYLNSAGDRDPGRPAAREMVDRQSRSRRLVGWFQGVEL